MSQLKSRVPPASTFMRRCALVFVMGALCAQVTANPTCPADFDGDGAVTGADISLALMDFGACGANISCQADLDGDAEVTAADISLLLMDFGACPNWYTVLEDAPDPAVVWDATLRAAIAATGKPWHVRDNGTGIEMVLIPPGTFAMGALPEYWNPYGICFPRHDVTLTKGFYMSRTEVTQAQWVATMGSNPSYWRGDTSRPVEQVSWYDIQPFCTATGLRLATEAEWEYAYRAGTDTAYHGMPGYLDGTNDYNQLHTIGWGPYNNPTGGTHPVACKAPNGFGLYDMSGNVWEWCQDWFAPYSSGPQTNPAGPADADPGYFSRVMRGGGIYDVYPCVTLQASDRGEAPPDDPGYYGGLGFRVVRNP